MKVTTFMSMTLRVMNGLLMMGSVDPIRAALATQASLARALI